MPSNFIFTRIVYICNDSQFIRSTNKYLTELQVTTLIRHGFGPRREFLEKGTISPNRFRSARRKAKEEQNQVILLGGRRHTVRMYVCEMIAVADGG